MAAEADAFAAWFDRLTMRSVGLTMRGVAVGIRGGARVGRGWGAGLLRPGAADRLFGAADGHFVEAVLAEIGGFAGRAGRAGGVGAGAHVVEAGFLEVARLCFFGGGGARHPHPPLRGTFSRLGRRGGRRGGFAGGFLRAGQGRWAAGRAFAPRLASGLEGFAAGAEAVAAGGGAVAFGLAAVSGAAGDGGDGVFLHRGGGGEGVGGVVPGGAQGGVGVGGVAPASPHPALRATFSRLGRRGGGGAGLEAEFQFPGLQALDFVAQAGGLFEVEIGGGVAHLLLQVFEMGFEVVADQGAGRGVGADPDGDVVLFVVAVEDVGDVGLDRGGGDAVFGVVGLLLLAAAVGLGDGALHRAGLAVGVEDDLAVDVARRAADGLDQRGFGAQETLLVGIEDGDEGAFGDVEALAQEVDADEAVEAAEAEVADDLDAFEGVDVRVHVADADALLVEIFGEILGHALGEDGGEDAKPLGDGVADFAEEVVDLGTGGANLDGRVDEAGGADHLLGEDAAGLFQLPGRGGGRDGDGLRPHGVPLLEAERAVVHGRTAGESRIRRASPCGGSRRDTWRRSAAR